MELTSDSIAALIVEHFRGHNRKMFVAKAVNIIFRLKEYLPLTVRHVFYQLVAQLTIENSQNKYNSVSKVLAKLRRLGILPWESIQDRTRRLTDKRGFEDAGAFLRQQLTGLSNTYDRCLD